MNISKASGMAAASGTATFAGQTSKNGIFTPSLLTSVRRRPRFFCVFLDRFPSSEKHD